MTATGAERTYPRVRVAGDALERGTQYGARTRSRVLLSLEAYERVFAYYTGRDWERVKRECQAYLPAIEAAHPALLDEMRGIAKGAGVEFEDILALNLRTEIMYAAKARMARGMAPPPAECSSFCIMPEASANGRLMVGQNWDWLPHCLETVVVLEAKQEGKPDFVTVVEAGLLAKCGMNSAGIGSATNALVTDHDKGEPGLPYHVMLRAFLDAGTITEALGMLQKWVRSSSANYLLAHAGGIGVAVEAAPGDFSRLYYITPNDGLLVHTNHFLSQLRDVKDVSVWAMPDSLVRLQRLASALRAARPVSVDALTGMLADHADHPFGVCCHPDTTQHPVHQGATILSIIMEPAARSIWLADGNPCSTPYRRLEYEDFFSHRRTTMHDHQGV